MAFGTGSAKIYLKKLTALISIGVARNSCDSIAFVLAKISRDAADIARSTVRRPPFSRHSKDIITGFSTEISFEEINRVITGSALFASDFVELI
jgi:hypothetical protein